MKKFQRTSDTSDLLTAEPLDLNPGPLRHPRKVNLYWKISVTHTVMTGCSQSRARVNLMVYIPIRTAWTTLLTYQKMPRKMILGDSTD